MKRIISIIAVVAMLATMIVVPVSAQNTANAVVVGPMSIKGTAAAVTAGEAQQVNAIKFTKAAGSADNKVGVPFSETELNSYTGYDANDRIHISFSYLTPSKSPDSFAIMMADYGLDISDRYSLASVPVNKWVKFDLFLQPQWTYVYNDGEKNNTLVVNKLIDKRGTKEAVGAGFWEELLENDYDASKTYTLKNVTIGKYDVYVNGEKAFSRNSRKLGYDYEGYYSSVATNRIAFYASDANNAREFYIHNGKVDVINDFNASTFDFGMASLTDGTNYVARGTSLYTRKSITAGDIASDYSVSAYTYADGVYTAIPKDETLNVGDVVIINDATASTLNINYLTVCDEKIYPYSNGNLTLANSSNVVAGTGVAGKDAADTSAASAPANDVFFNTTSGAGNVDGSNNVFIYTFKGYKVISVNLFVSDNTKGGVFRITGQYGSVYAGDIPVSTLVPNQWNKVDFVLKMDAAYGDGYDGTEPSSLTGHLYNGTSSVYVNETLVKSNQKHAFGGWVKAAGSDPVRDGYTLRVGYSAIPQDVSAYMDDISSYYTYFTPVLDETPRIYGDVVSGNNIYAEAGKTVADTIKKIENTDNCVIKTFDVSGATYTPADGSAVSIGKTVVVSNASNRYSYYTIKDVADAKNYIYTQNFDIDAGLTNGNTTALYTSSLAGKSADDTSFGFGVGYLTGAGGVVESETSITGYADKNGTPVTADNFQVDENGNKKKNTNSDRFVTIDTVDGMKNFSEISKMKGYKVVSVNMMYTGNATSESFRITSNNSASVSGFIPLTKLQPNQWNRVDFVIEMQGNKTPPAQKVDGVVVEVPNGVCTTYVNGRKVSERNSCYGSYIWHYALANYSSCAAFRLGFGIGADSDVVGYIDDYVSYFTPFAPDMTEFDTAPYAVKAQVGDAIPSGEGVAVYTDDTYSAVASGNIALGNVVVTETVADSENAIKRYGYCKVAPVMVEETAEGIRITSTYDSGILAVAEYDNGEFVGVSVADLSETKTIDYAPEGTNVVKIIVVDGANSLKPLGEYIRY